MITVITVPSQKCLTLIALVFHHIYSKAQIKLSLLSFHPLVLFLKCLKYFIFNLTPVFTEALFTIVKACKQSKCPSTGEWKKMWGKYTNTHMHNIYIQTYIVYTHTYIIYIYTHPQWNITELWKEWNIAICSNMIGLRDYSSKWSKSE